MPEIVDVHAHVLLPELQERVRALDPAGFAAAEALDAARNGPASLAASGAMIRERWPALTDLDRRLGDMDGAEVDRQIVSPSPSHYYPWLDPAAASEEMRRANDAVAALVDRAPQRLSGLGLTALQHPELAVELLNHAVLELGLLGVEIPSAAGIRELSDPALDDFWARAAELDAMVFLHPFGCTLDERLDRYYLSNSVGQPVENAVAISHLVFGGVLDRHPALRLVAAHGGGYLPTFLGRNDHAWQVRPEARTCRERPSAYLHRLYFDSLVHSPEALRALVAAVGADRVLLGSDYPFDMGVADPVDRVRAAGLLPQEAEAILTGNVASLLPGTDLLTSRRSPTG